MQNSEVADRLPETELEPQRYSALIVRTVTDGGDEQTTETRIARNGGLSRQEWMENGERRALIWRPDLGKSFCLSLDRALYTESQLDSGSNGESTGSPSAQGSDNGPLTERAQALDQALPGPEDADSIEVEAKPDVTASGFSCRVTEQRMKFADGHVEVTKTYRAVRFGGLAVRVENEGPGQHGTVRVVTELRNITLDVVDREFDVPEHFRRVERL